MPNGLFDDTWTSRRMPWASAARADVGRAAGVDLLEVVDPGGVDHAGGVDHVDVAREAVEELDQTVRSADIADHGLDTVDAAQRRVVVGVGDERSDRAGPGVRPVAQLVRQGPARAIRRRR